MGIAKKAYNGKSPPVAMKTMKAMKAMRR